MIHTIRKQNNIEVLKYVRKRIRKSSFPSYAELNKKFDLINRKLTMKEIYSKLGVSNLGLPVKRPNGSLKELRNELIDYVRKEVESNHHPSRRYIESKFKLTIGHLFGSIHHLYEEAGLEYSQKNSQELKTKKAQMLTDIVLLIMPAMNLSLVEVRGVHDRGVDILAEDPKGRSIGIEIKAHNEYEPIKKRNFLQLRRFLKQEKLDKIILVTTTSRFENDIGEIAELEIVDYKKLSELCTKDQMNKLKFIRNKSVHQETN